MFAGLLMNKLTPKQERFCQEYIIDLNATQAAIRAGYSKNTANEIGAENLTKPSIVEHLQSLQKPIAEKALVDAEYVLRGLKNIADTMERNMISVDENGVETVNPSAAQASARAHELLGKHLVLFTDKVINEHKVDDLEELAATKEYLKKHGIDADRLTH
jgi:phage terminase small subunit